MLHGSLTRTAWRVRVLAGTVLGLAVGLAAPAVAAHEIRAGSLAIEHPWARATAAKQKNGAAYMIIRNPTAEADRLVAVRCADAASASLHDSSVDAQGIARMREVDAVEVPANGELRLMPGGVHVMLAGLKTPLSEGVSFPLTLVFERAGTVGVEVAVQGSDAPTEHDGAPVGGDHGGTHGGH